MRLPFARWSVRYTGRLATTLPEAVGSLMINDGTFVIWARCWSA